ncbi:MAG: NAD(+)/NADH kinase, partial [Bauldia litoralis]
MTTRFAFIATDTPEAQDALAELSTRYKTVPPDEAEVVVALGGDGFMLETLHDTLRRHVAVFGMNRGTVGFLMNEYAPDRLEERIERAARVDVHPLT